MVNHEEAREAHAADECKAEILRRVTRYKRAPSMAALIHRLDRFCGGPWAVEVYTLQLIKSGQLRVTDGTFYVPQKWDALSDLGHR